jgi:hypothetical protein
MGVELGLFLVGVLPHPLLEQEEPTVLEQPELPPPVAAPLIVDVRPSARTRTV